MSERTSTTLVCLVIFLVAHCSSNSDKLREEVDVLTRANNNAQTSMRDMCDAIHHANSEIDDHNTMLSDTDYVPVDNIRVPAGCMR